MVWPVGQIRAGVVAMFASVLLPTTGSAQSDYRTPRFKGLQAITVSVNVFTEGNGASSPSPCQVVKRAVLEHFATKKLHETGLNAIGGAERQARLLALLAEDKEALRTLQASPRTPQPPGFSEQARQRTREGDFLASQPLLYVQVGVTTLDGGLCAAGITTELRAFTREPAVINYSGEQVRATLALWAAPSLALAAPAGELEHALEDRFGRQITAFVTVWREANGR